MEVAPPPGPHAPRRPSTHAHPASSSNNNRRASGGHRHGIGSNTGRKEEKNKGGRTNSTRHMKTLGPYLIGKTVGEGTFGKVKIGLHNLTGEKVAIKILEKSKITEKADVRRVTREINILKRNRHRNIIQLFEVLDTPSAIYLIMEHADGGEMFDFIVAHQRVPEPQACYFFHQIVDGVEYLHLMEVTHRDLKPENLLLQASAAGWVVKIVDFGLSNTHEGGQLLSTACGSPCYAAPEMIAGKKYVGPKADIWSMGVILFALVCGYLPFEDPNTSNLYKKILAGDYRPPSNISREVRDLIHRILDTNPETRYSVADIRRHPWYRQVHMSPPPFALSNTSQQEDDVLDETVLAQAEGLGLPPDMVTAAVRSRLHNTVTATYYLLLHKLQRQREEAGEGGALAPPTAKNAGRRPTVDKTPAAPPTAVGTLALPTAAPPVEPSTGVVAETAETPLIATGNPLAPTAKPPVPRLSLQELQALKPTEEATIDIVPSYQRQTISGASKTARPADSSSTGGSGSRGSVAVQHSGSRAGRMLKGPASRGSMTARAESPSLGVGASPPNGTSVVPRAPSRPRSRVRTSGNNVRVTPSWVQPQDEEGEAEAERPAEAPRPATLADINKQQQQQQQQQVIAVPPATANLDSPPCLPHATRVLAVPPGPVPTNLDKHLTAVLGKSASPGERQAPTGGGGAGVEGEDAAPPYEPPAAPPALHPTAPVSANHGGRSHHHHHHHHQSVPTAPVDQAPAQDVTITVVTTPPPTSDPDVAVVEEGPRHSEQGSDGEGDKAQQPVALDEQEAGLAEEQGVVRERRSSTGSGSKRRYSKYVSQLSQRDAAAILSEASRALAGMEILTIEYENCVLKCAGRGLQFKLQVKSKLPEQQQYIKVTCYSGPREDFRCVCADLFRQVPL